MSSSSSSSKPQTDSKFTYQGKSPSADSLVFSLKSERQTVRQNKPQGHRHHQRKVECGANRPSSDCAVLWEFGEGTIVDKVFLKGDRRNDG